ncbi:MAG TPA: class I SAM-dependent methyltransferase [Solirubrobacteraceae bacterium]|nr:class I SAM-dependent methyltransferase [Solirubrobacteraceae bacterium]
MSPVHSAASEGFGRAGDDYEKGRPGYPPAALARLRDALGLGPGRTVLDLAAGTGKLTRALTGSGAEVIAVEPVDGMRAMLVAALPRVTALTGTAEAIPLADHAVDAVCVAQAFHWFDAPAAAAEIHRVLAPGGRLAVLWNAWDESIPWVAAVMAIVHAHAQGAPQQRTSRWPQEVQATGLFGPMTQLTVPNPVSGDRDTLVARIVSTSYIAALPPEGRDQVSHDVLAVVDGDPQTAAEPTLVMPYTTHLTWCERR